MRKLLSASKRWSIEQPAALLQGGPISSSFINCCIHVLRKKRNWKTTENNDMYSQQTSLNCK